METKANYVLIGAFTLLAAVALLLFALWAAKFSADREWQRYMIVFNEPVTGLSEGSSVQYNGISVGTVTSLSLAPEDPRRVIAVLRIQADVPVKTDTRAKMSQDGLTGPPFIQLTGGSPEAPLLAAVSEREVPIIAAEASALQNIADTANRLVARLDALLSEENIERVSSTLDNVEAVTSTLAAQREDMRLIIVNAREASAELEATIAATRDVVADVDRDLTGQLPALVGRLDNTLVKLESAATGADTIVAENRGAISSFTNDGLGQVGPTLNELRKLTRDLRQMSDRLEGGPAGYLLGRDAPKEFVPE